MAATGPGLGDVLDFAFKGRRQDSGGTRTLTFGAAGKPGFGPDYELLGAVGSVSPDFLSDLILPMDRMFRTIIGQRVVGFIGNETRTLAAIQRLSVEIMAEALRFSGQAKGTDRMLVIPDHGRHHPVLMLMSPSLKDVESSRIISNEADLSLSLMEKAAYEIADQEAQTPEGIAVREVLKGGTTSIAEIFLISRPEIVLTRRPRMIPLCVPSPHMKVSAQGKISTAGIFCRDSDGELGITACYHGTGPVGTDVSVDQHKSSVKHASVVQDIVFIPLGNGFNVPQTTGLGGVQKSREPAKADHARFDGATNQNRQTRIFGTDNGLLRARPTLQLKIQTDPDTDEGDSGSALLDQNDRVLGFAFERTDYNDYPQFTDWIWAANALGALQLIAL